MAGTNKCPEGMFYIPGGTFKMGSTNGDLDERPVRDVTISPLCADKHEATNADYRAVTAQSEEAKFELIATACGGGTSVVARGSDPKALARKHAKKLDGRKVCGLEVKDVTPSSGEKPPAGFDRPNQPVVLKNWHEAKAYCEAQGKRLPTEAEWEYMARGPEGHEYGTRSGELKSSEARYNSSAPADVCSYPENGFGLCDMTGNVWEWTADWYQNDAYKSMVPKDPKGPADGKLRVVRGGSWPYNIPRYLRAAYRYSFHPEFRSILIGFRCVAAPQDSKK